MADEELKGVNGQDDTDAYYGEDDIDADELDLSFLDEEEDDGTEKSEKTQAPK